MPLEVRCFMACRGVSFGINTFWRLMASRLLNNRIMSKITFGSQQIKSIKGRRPRVLILESNTPVREGLARALKLESFDVTTAAKGSEVLFHDNDTAAFDTVLLDLDRPDENRWQT